MLAATVARPARAAACADLLKLELPHTVIQRAESIPAGRLADVDPMIRADLPAFCRVVAKVTSAPGSDVAVEVWLPTDHWTGVFHGNGSGGYGGSLKSGYGGMAAGLRRGYAAAATDTGSAPATALDGDALIGQPLKWRDWGLLSTHVMTATGKAIAKAYYGQAPRRAYFTGCSTGGQQGLIEAQYYPDDYDGVLVGAPVINRTWGHAAVLWDYLAANLTPGHKLSDAKLALLNAAAVSTCGGKGAGLPGAGFIADPLACRFDPAVLTCRGADANACLTPEEVQTAKAFYSGPVNRAGRRTYYGWLPGSESPGPSGWAFLQSAPGGHPAFDSLFKWVFGADWDWRGFDLDRDMPRVDAALGPDLNGVTRGDLSRFRARGSKLIIYQGWADTLVAPGQTLAFYDGLAAKIGGTAKVRDFARLFMAPGVMHCGGGPGPNAFNSANAGAPRPPSDSPQHDLFAAIVQWVETGVAPAQVIATRYDDDAKARGPALQRPLCALPDKAWYRGVGDTRDAGSFICSRGPPASASHKVTTPGS